MNTALLAAVRLLIATAALALALAPVQAKSVRPPLGLQLFCLQNPDQCRAGTSGSVDLDAHLMGALKQANSRINGQIIPRAEQGDVWTVGGQYGDCEDYAMTKRAYLIQQGVPRGALRIAHTVTAGGEGHAILVVRTSGGDLVLDNLRSSVVPLSRSGYQIISMSTSDPKLWTGI